MSQGMDFGEKDGVVKRRLMKAAIRSNESGLYIFELAD